MNLKSIADAIAARYSGISATNGALTETILIGPTASLPNSITRGPALLVYHPIGELTVGVSAINTDAYEFPVKLLRDPLNVPERSDWLYAWFTAMRYRIEGNTDLDLPTVVGHAETSSARIELDGEEYAGNTFDVVELNVHVQLYELSAPVGV